MQLIATMMQGLAARAQAVAEALGGPGLTVVAFVDSSFLTLPEVADLLVVLFTIRSPEDWLYLSAMTTLGSVLGSYALFLLGRKGGAAVLRRRIHERHLERGLGWFRRFGAWALVIPAMLPPPMPFKAVVLLAGVAGINRTRFVAAVAIGRGLRYGGESLLAKWYGASAVAFVQQNVFDLAVPAAGLAVFGFLAWLVWRRFGRSTRRVGAADVE